MIYKILEALVKTGSMKFDSVEECLGFAKMAQEAVDPMMLQQMAMGQGAAPPMPQAMPPEMGQEMAPPMMPNMPSPESTIVGESISSKDIEGLVKILNVITSLKSQYDAIKKDQMAMIQDQMQAAQGGMPAGGAA